MLKSIVIGAAVLLALSFSVVAGEVPQAVKDACKGDYETHCSAHEPEGQAAHDCMASVFEKLSDPCVTAILDSPLVEQEQQRLADAQASKTTEPVHKVRTADAKSSKRVGPAKRVEPAKRVANAKHARHTKYAAVKSNRHTAQRVSAPRRSVAGHIRRGTHIARHYVAKYTRFAFAKAFR